MVAWFNTSVIEALFYRALIWDSMLAMQKDWKYMIVCDKELSKPYSELSWNIPKSHRETFSNFDVHTAICNHLGIFVHGFPYLIQVAEKDGTNWL